MTGNVAIATNLTAEGYGGQSGSAYRRSGRFTYRESTRATGPAQAPARVYRELLCLCPLWVRIGRGGPAASVTRATALPVAALRLWQGRLWESSTANSPRPPPKLGSVALTFVAVSGATRGACIGPARKRKRSESCRQSPSEPSRQPRQEGSTVSEASKPKIPQRTRALAVECRRSPGTGLSAQQGCAFGG